MLISGNDIWHNCVGLNLAWGKEEMIISPSYKLHVQMSLKKSNQFIILWFKISLICRSSFITVEDVAHNDLRVYMKRKIMTTQFRPIKQQHISCCNDAWCNDATCRCADAACRIANDGYNRNFACCRSVSASPVFNPLKTKRRPLYLKTQSVPRCKHFSSGL
jgi:hypothetical protein